MGPAIALGLSLVAIAQPSAAEPPKPAPPTNASAPTPASSTSAPSTSTNADAAKEKKARQARAVELHDEAKALYERGLYRRAIAKLEAAIELDPDGKELVYNLALIHEKLAEADVAEGYYLRYIEMETDPKARERAVVIVKRIRGAKKTLEADLQERAVAPTASSGPVTAAAPTDAIAPVSRTPSPMVFVIGGVAVAAVGVGIGFGISALTTHPANATTGPGVTADDLETRARSAHTQAVIADLSLVTSLVVGAAAAVLYLLETRTSRAPAAAPAASPPTASPASSARAAAIPFRVEAPF